MLTEPLVWVVTHETSLAITGAFSGHWFTQTERGFGSDRKAKSDLHQRVSQRTLKPSAVRPVRVSAFPSDVVIRRRFGWASFASLVLLGFVCLFVFEALSAKHISLDRRLLELDAPTTSHPVWRWLRRAARICRISLQGRCIMIMMAIMFIERSQ